MIKKTIFLLFFPFFLSHAFDEKIEKEMAKEKEQINSMLNDGKVLLGEMKKIQIGTKIVAKYRDQENCQEMADVLQEKVTKLAKELENLKHPFWGYLKGAVKYAYFCGSCDKKAAEKFCPLMDMAIDKYNSIY